MKNLVCLLIGALALTAAMGCSPTPVDLEIIPESVVLDGADATQKLVAKVLDGDGNPISEGVDVLWFSEDSKIFKLATDGTLTAVASGEGEVEAEVVGADIKKTVEVRVKIASSINVSHEKLRLWTGQVKDNVWSEVHSEKGAFIEGFMPEWSSEDPTIVKVEQINDPNRRQSWVKLTGMKSGNTHIITSFRHLMKSVRVRVYDEDEEVALDGTRIPKNAKEKAQMEKDKWKSTKEKKKKKKSPKKMKF
jgi:hypothetical protein